MLCSCHVDPLRQLGNYFGALANWVKLQSTAAPGDKLFFSVVGWHALTLPQDPNLLSEARTTVMALILASGIDAQRSIVFHQDEVTAQFDSIVTSPLDAQTGPGSCRTCLDSELYNTNWKAEADDDMEGPLHCTHFLPLP